MINYGENEYWWEDLTIAGVVQRFCKINAGSFMMGSQKTEPERFDDEILHKVTLTEDFWLADTACTQELWEAVMGENPSHFVNPSRPVENVSWDDCQKFLKRIDNSRPGLGLRLPTEAEWEYACRAGTVTPFNFGDNITSKQVAYNGRKPYNKGREGLYRKKTVPVKSLPCNQWGLYEMHGNVWEWCSDRDRYGRYVREAEIDPIGPVEGGGRVVRGGSWFSKAGSARSANRDWCRPDGLDRNLGVRFARAYH